MENLLVTGLATLGLLLVNNKISIKLSLCALGIQALSFAVYHLANYLGKDGFNEAALAHVQHAFNIESLTRFWPLTAAFIAGTVALVWGLLALNRVFAQQYFRVSQPITTAISLAIPLVLCTQLLSNPLVGDLTDLIKSRQMDKSFMLPEKFQSIEALAPKIQYTSPRTKANFIIIFAESLESAFLEQDVYPNLMPLTGELISERGSLVKGITEITLSNWTDAALSAALCGVSMNPSYSDFGLSENEISERIRNRTKATDMIGETCIGDILTNDGYLLGFYGGSDFGSESKSLLLKSQGFSSINMTNEILVEIGKPMPQTSWGLYDDALLDFVTQKLSKKTAAPQGSILLTVDTHIPGYVSPKCVNNKQVKIKNEFLDSVRCSDKIISEFILNILSDPSHNETVIFLISDHLLPGQLPRKTIPRTEREYLFAVFNSKLNKAKLLRDRQATPFDIAPTILAHLGYQIDTLNFGRNLSSDTPTLVETINKQVLSLNIVKLRHTMREHWKNSKNCDLDSDQCK